MALNPYFANIFIDSCAFDPKYEPETTCSSEIFSLYERQEINLIVSHSVLKESEHPNTPARIKVEAASKIYSLDVNLTPEEKNKKQEIWTILTGNGKPEKMKQDATHVFDAHRHGGYFVTTDNRILKKKPELCKICNTHIVTPCELVQLLNEHKDS